MPHAKRERVDPLKMTVEEMVKYINHNEDLIARRRISQRKYQVSKRGRERFAAARRKYRAKERALAPKAINSTG